MAAKNTGEKNARIAILVAGISPSEIHAAEKDARIAEFVAGMSPSEIKAAKTAIALRELNGKERRGPNRLASTGYIEALMARTDPKTPGDSKQ